jgi:hypothetical protein
VTGEQRPDSLLHNEQLVAAVAEKEHWAHPDWQTWERVKGQAHKLVAAGELTDLYIISDGRLLSTVTGVAAHPAGKIATLLSQSETPILDAAAEVILGFRGPWQSPDEKRIAEIRLLFFDRGYKMGGPSRLGDGTDLAEPVEWVVRYVRKDVSGRAPARGVGGTPLDAAENAWAKFQAEER